ncbi:MAG: type I restriction enzyme HsdR N-terminal domain-containing protein [Bacteroidales bacterium]|nr:type I restriction enzyme HsdR N-terminal domain-containing protein [Bacteroidales bacterium]
MKQLNLPGYSFRIIEEDGFRKIFDPVRKKFVKLTPEEWVRQNFITYLVRILGYPVGLISVEKAFRWNRLNRRTDILVHNRKGVPVMVVECKAPNVRIDATVFDQVFTYNMKLDVPLLVVTNGLVHFACRVGDEPGKYTFLETLPQYCDIGSFLKGND